MDKNMNPWDNKPRLRGNTPIYTPKELIEKAVEYFNIADGRRWEKPIYVGRDGRLEHLQLKVPFSIESFCVHANISKNVFNDYADRINRVKPTTKEGKKTAKEYKIACDWIKNVIFSQNYEGGAIGVFNHNLVSRKLGLIDKQDVTSQGESIKRLEGVKIELPEGVDLRSVKDVDYEDLSEQKELKK